MEQDFNDLDENNLGKKNQGSLDDTDGLGDLDWSDISGDIDKNRKMLRNELEESTDIASQIKKTSHSGAVAIDFLYDVSLNLTVEVGTRKMLISEVLKYEIGSIIELNNVVGQQLNIFVNDVLVGFGQILEKNHKYGVKITYLLDERQRLEALSEKAMPRL